MSPPREQMQFVSNQIVSKLVFSRAPAAHVSDFKGAFCCGVCSVRFGTG